MTASSEDKKLASAFNALGPLAGLLRRGPRQAAVPATTEGRETMPVTIVGDSHVELFEHLATEPLELPDGRIVDANVLAVKGATIRGCGRKKSTLDVRRNSLGAIRPIDQAVVLCYGQVDIELGYYYRLHVKREELEYEAFAQELADSYVERIAALPLVATPILKGVNLSVLTHSRRRAIIFTSQILFETPDDAEKREALVAELEEVFPEADELDRRHRIFNAYLKAACLRQGVEYFDFLEATTEPISGRIRRSYVPGGNNHHALKKPDLLAIVRRSLASALMCASIGRSVTQQSRKLDTVPQND